MRVIEDRCCDCASPLYPCINCSRRHTEVIYCDICGDEESEDRVQKYDGKEICFSCYCEMEENELEEESN